ncbi:MAG: acyl carrier protein [Anaerolineales bacterium]
MTDEIETTLAKYIAEKILKQPKRVIGPGDRLISSGLIDSFHLVDLALFVEETFRVRIDDTELNAQTFDTLAALAAIIRARQMSQ